jgi:hypothetical protein
MMSNVLLDELTDTHSVSIIQDARSKEYVAEVFIKDIHSVWYAVLRYGYEPSLAKLYRDTYARRCKSPRPYMAGQACDGSITSPVFHLYNQLCDLLGLDPILIYNEAYDDHLFTRDQLAENIAFAEWQGVEIIESLDARKISDVIRSLNGANLNKLATVLEEKIPL